MSGLTPNHKVALISISTPGKHYDFSPELAGWSSVLRLNFSDVVQQYDENGWRTTVFDEAMSQEVLEFLRGLDRTSVTDIMVHCDKGLSRSVALAFALSEAGWGELQLHECHRPLQANRLVLSVMERALKQPIRSIDEDPFWST